MRHSHSHMQQAYRSRGIWNDATRNVTDGLYFYNNIKHFNYYHFKFITDGHLYQLCKIHDIELSIGEWAPFPNNRFFQFLNLVRGLPFLFLSFYLPFVGRRQMENICNHENVTSSSNTLYNKKQKYKMTPSLSTYEATFSRILVIQKQMRGGGGKGTLGPRTQRELSVSNRKVHYNPTDLPRVTI